MLQYLFQDNQIVGSVSRTEFDGANVDPPGTSVVCRGGVQFKAGESSRRGVFREPVDEAALAAADIREPGITAELHASVLHERPKGGTLCRLQVEHEVVQ